MLSAALFLLANSLFLTLRLTGDTGSFPKPLSAGFGGAEHVACDRGGR